MLKKTISYVDYNGEPREDDYYFHLSKAEVVEMEVSHKNGMHAYLTSIAQSQDGKAIISVVKDLILSSYGQKSEDGRRFIKSQELRDEFASSKAYEAMFMELCTDAEKAAEFINGIIPEGLEADIAKLMTQQKPPQLVESRTLTLQEATEMEQDELRSGLATGRYKLS